MTKNKIISAIIILALCVCVIMSLASCNTMNDSDDENTTSSAQTTANDTEGEANESTTADATDTEDAESTSAEDASSEGTSAEDASDTESSDVTSEETTEERFDYFSADLSKYGYVDSKEYESFEVSVGPEFEVTEEAVNAYIEQLCYNYRQATNGSTKVTNKPTKVGAYRVTRTERQRVFKCVFESIRAYYTIQRIVISVPGNVQLILSAIAVYIQSVRRKL